MKSFYDAIISSEEQKSVLEFAAIAGVPGNL
jgi:hypothetical protein